LRGSSICEQEWGVREEQAVGIRSERIRQRIRENQAEIIRQRFRDSHAENQIREKQAERNRLRHRPTHGRCPLQLVFANEKFRHGVGHISLS